MVIATWNVSLSALLIQTTDLKISNKLMSFVSLLNAIALQAILNMNKLLILKGKNSNLNFLIRRYSNWELEHFGTDRDLYDKDGNQIYEYVGDNLYHRDLDKNGTWLDTWHLEENKTHPEGYRSKENYYEEL